MEKQQMLEQAKEKLTPFETSNIIDFIQHLTPESAMEHPLIVGAFVVIAIVAIVKKSKFALMFLFSVISIMLLVRFTLTPETSGGELSIASTIPFAVGGVVIGGVLIYMAFIKGD